MLRSVGAARQPESLLELYDFVLPQYEGGKPNTIKNNRAASNLLQSRFGPRCAYRSLRRSDGDPFRSFLRSKYAETTVSSNCRKAKRFFNVAGEDGRVDDNPFDGQQRWGDKCGRKRSNIGQSRTSGRRW
jgi:hypothetical protein